MDFELIEQVKAKLLQYLYRVPYFTDKRLSNWEKLLKQDLPRFNDMAKQARGGQKILIASSVGGHGAVAELDMLLMAALTVRGACVQALLCDGCLPACEMCTFQATPSISKFANRGNSRTTCTVCHETASLAYSRLGLSVHRYSDFLSNSDYDLATQAAKNVPFDKIPTFIDQGVRIGEHALAGTLRFFAKSSLSDERYAEPVLRHYLKAALLTAVVARVLLNKHKIDRAVFHHGIYVPQGVFGDVCRNLNVNVVNWQVAYRKQCFIFSHGDTYHHTLMTEDTKLWENIPFPTSDRNTIIGYLESRRRGANDWIYFHNNPNENFADIKNQFEIDDSLPIIGLLTNVCWDAQLHYPTNVFENMLEWIKYTVAYFIKRPDLQLVIRIHPAESTGFITSRQLVYDEIHKFFPELPANIIIIKPEHRVSTYSLMRECNSVIIYATKTGVELTSFGIPVIVAGESWIRGKGLTEDIFSKAHYDNVLQSLPLGSRLDQATVERALKYAFHFFFRRMIPVTSIQESSKSSHSPYSTVIKELDDILPGQDDGLDVITNGILFGANFIYQSKQSN